MCYERKNYKFFKMDTDKIVKTRTHESEGGKGIETLPKTQILNNIIVHDL